MTSSNPAISSGAAKPGTAGANLNLSKEGWYTETSSLWPGQGLSLQVDEVLFQDRSDFQAGRRLSPHLLLLSSCCWKARDLSLGPAGCLRATQQGFWHCSPP